MQVDEILLFLNDRTPWLRLISLECKDKDGKHKKIVWILAACLLPFYTECLNWGENELKILKRELISNQSE